MLQTLLKRKKDEEAVSDEHPRPIGLQRILTKNLNFSVSCKKLDYADDPVNVELFFKDKRNLDILSNEYLNFVKAKTKEAALLSYRTYNNNVPPNLFKGKFIALQKFEQPEI